MKLVLDTNVLISGLMFPGWNTGTHRRSMARSALEVALSLDQLAEIGRVLEYPKIRRKLGWNSQHIELFIKQLYIRSEVVELGPILVEVPEILATHRFWRHSKLPTRMSW